MTVSSQPPAESRDETRLHCSDCDRPALCDIIKRGTAPCGMNAGMARAASDLYEESEIERRRLTAEVSRLSDALREARAANEQLTSAVRWALGEEGAFVPAPDLLLDVILAGKRSLGTRAHMRLYWWRSELRERAFGSVPTPERETASPESVVGFHHCEGCGNITYWIDKDTPLCAFCRKPFVRSVPTPERETASPDSERQYREACEGAGLVARNAPSRGELLTKVLRDWESERDMHAVDSVSWLGWEAHFCEPIRAMIAGENPK